MEDRQFSLTALLTAYARAYHATHDTPKILDDYIAARLFTEEERASIEQNLAQALPFFEPELAASCPDQATALAWVMRAQSTPITLSRGRYTEDRLELAVEHGVRQYVILGAGLETFAFRRSDLVDHLQIFEVDHPATQAFKRTRLAELGWELPPQLHFVPMDFEKDGLALALEGASYDAQVVSLFSWLGVTYYLTPDVVLAMLRAIAEIAPAGSSVIFDYIDLEAFIPGQVATRMQRMQEIVRRTGEPMRAGFDPSTLATDLEGIGLRLQENLSPSDIEERYFKGRRDGYHAFEHVHLAWAAVE
jgi:methyltransferase (TIGR00027 family)